MKKYLLAAVAALAIGGVAHASDMTCHLADQRGNTLDYTFHWVTGAVQELGFTRNGQDANYSHTPLWHGFDNRDSSTLTSDDAPGWFITYATTPGNDRAALWHNRNIVAQGACDNVPEVAAAPAYTPPPAPVPAYSPPPPAPAGEDSVGLINVGKGVMVQVTLGSQPVTMIVDTGATGMLVPAKVADKLVASGEASNADDAKIQQADGNTVTERTILIHSLTIGRHTIIEVRASVAPDGPDAMGLLPFPVLNRAGRFTIDTTTNKLIFG